MQQLVHGLVNNAANFSVQIAASIFPNLAGRIDQMLVKMSPMADGASIVQLWPHIFGRVGFGIGRQHAIDGAQLFIEFRRGVLVARVLGERCVGLLRSVLRIVQFPNIQGFGK